MKKIITLTLTFSSILLLNNQATAQENYEESLIRCTTTQTTKGYNALTCMGHTPKLIPMQDTDGVSRLVRSQMDAICFTENNHCQAGEQDDRIVGKFVFTPEFLKNPIEVFLVVAPVTHHIVQDKDDGQFYAYDPKFWESKETLIYSSPATHLGTIR